jgi:hypothetical protein
MKWVAISLAAAMVTGCAGPGTIYEWGGYQPALNGYTKSGDTAQFETVLLATIATGEENGRIPPGIYAELGFLLFNTNRPAEAVIFFQREKEAFPESAILMDRLILGAERASEAEAKPEAEGTVEVEVQAEEEIDDAA